MSRSLPGGIVTKDKSKWKGRKMLKEWRMFRVAESHRNGGNVYCREGVVQCITIRKY